jgi:hypothetical protein
VFAADSLRSAVVMFSVANGVYDQRERSRIIGGLTPGDTYFVQGMFRVDGGSDIDINHQVVSVKPVA